MEGNFVVRSVLSELVLLSDIDVYSRVRRSMKELDDNAVPMAAHCRSITQ
jgi:hypothetical protein